MTQCNRILDHIKSKGSITPKEADDLFGIMRLGARIYDLRRSGHKIDMVWETAQNRYGEQTRFAKYIYRGCEN